MSAPQPRPPSAWRQAGDWPNRASSRFVRAAGLTWHVQIMGRGPALLLAHGTAASAHSWRDLAPLLADAFTVVAPDLPGHGFTRAPYGHDLSLPGMARDLAGLLAALPSRPVLGVGHSAGAAILARTCLDGGLAPRGLVGLNAAFLPLRSSGAGRLFAPLARAMAALPLLPTLLAWRAGDPAMAARLLGNTGSRLDDAGVRLYARLIANPDHVSGALRMMAQWDLAPLVADLPRLELPLLLVVGDADRAIPPADGDRIAALIPGARVARQPGLGHLSHEEDAAGTAALVLQFAREVGALS